ncbi:MBL fold metallo-hydrolase [Leptolyngbya sp. NIES-2104]|uniref:MBL fold metallo-hydrolase n=1 Tax=Leptolyngbya sp. NIES-2104 TaxID=1552121 RepID=UPI0006EC8FFC|nr:hypothetical protein NIES2104_07390 [Leptolyngbya sp. NIES-2104]
MLLEEVGVTLRYCLETHLHADHITGTDRLCRLTGYRSVVPHNARVRGADYQMRDGEILKLGDTQIQALSATPKEPQHPVIPIVITLI